MGTLIGILSGYSQFPVGHWFPTRDHFAPGEYLVISEKVLLNTHNVWDRTENK